MYKRQEISRVLYARKVRFDISYSSPAVDLDHSYTSGERLHIFFYAAYLLDTALDRHMISSRLETYLLGGLISPCTSGTGIYIAFSYVYPTVFMCHIWQ